MNSTPSLLSSRRFRRLCLLGTVIALCVVVLGALVRLNHAGLGCPDWPGCYGHLTAGQAAADAAQANTAFPDRPVVEHKAFREMFHRFVAGACWIPVVFIQRRVRDMLCSKVAGGEFDAAVYRRLRRLWCVLGWPAFVGLVVVFHLIVNKPH